MKEEMIDNTVELCEDLALKYQDRDHLRILEVIMYLIAKANI